MAIRTIVWGENIHEQTNAVVRSIYPNGMHNTIADALNRDPAITATTATLQEPEHGLTEARLAETDVQISASQGCVGATMKSRMLRMTRSVATEQETTSVRPDAS